MSESQGSKFRRFLVASLIILFILLILQGLTLYYFSFITTDSENNDMHETYMEQLNNNTDLKIKEAQYVVQLLGDYVRTSTDLEEVFQLGKGTVELNNKIRNVSDQLGQILSYSSDDMGILLLSDEYLFGTVPGFPNTLVNARKVENLSFYGDLLKAGPDMSLLSRRDSKQELLRFFAAAYSSETSADSWLAPLRDKLEGGVVLAAAMKSDSDNSSFLLAVLVPYSSLLEISGGKTGDDSLVIVSGDSKFVYDPFHMTEEHNRSLLLQQITERPANTFNFDVGDKRHRVFSVKNSYSDLTLLSFVPLAEFHKDSHRIGLRLAGVMAISIIVIGTAILLFWTHTVISPVRKLLQAIRRNSSGVLRPRFRVRFIPWFNLSLKYKFILSYGVLFVIISYVLMYFCYTQTKQVIEKNRYSLYEMIARNAVDNTDKMFLSYKNLSRLIALDASVQNAALAQAPFDSRFANRITGKLLSNPFNMSGINNVTIYSIDGTLQFSLINGILNPGGRNLEEIVPDFHNINMYGYLYWSDAFRDSMNNNKFSIIREIRDSGIGMTFKKIGYMNLEINELVFNNLFNHLSNFNYDVLLVDRGEKIVSSGDKNYIGQPLSLYSGRSTSKDHLIIEIPLITNDWKMIFFVPLADIANHIKSNLIFNLYITLAFMLIISAFLYIFYHRLIFPLLHLNNLIKGTHSGSLLQHKYLKQIGGYDEVNELGENFNMLVDRINTLIRENYIIRLQESQLETHKKEIELQALQSQINPHFIYNTLDSINWMIMLERPKKAVAMVNSFSRLLRLSINKGPNVISIREELQHVLAYMDIQLQRYSDRLHFIVDVDPELFRYWTLKLILQPIVENAVNHGTESKAGHLIIVLRGYIDEGRRIVFKVIDDGGGMSRTEVIRLNRFEEKGGAGGIGLRNVHERIKMYCGDPHDLRIGSVHGGGTTVQLSLPLMKGDE